MRRFGRQKFGAAMTAFGAHRGDELKLPNCLEPSVLKALMYCLGPAFVHVNVISVKVERTNAKAST